MRLSTTATPWLRAVAKIRRSSARLSGCSQMCGGGTTLRISAPFAIANATNRSASAGFAKKSQCTVYPTSGRSPAPPGTDPADACRAAPTAASATPARAAASALAHRPPPAPNARHAATVAQRYDGFRVLPSRSSRRSHRAPAPHEGCDGARWGTMRSNHSLRHAGGGRMEASSRTGGACPRGRIPRGRKRDQEGAGGVRAGSHPDDERHRRRPPAAAAPRPLLHRRHARAGGRLPAGRDGEGGRHVRRRVHEGVRPPRDGSAGRLRGWGHARLAQHRPRRLRAGVRPASAASVSPSRSSTPPPRSIRCRPASSGSPRPSRTRTCSR